MATKKTQSNKPSGKKADISVINGSLVTEKSAKANTFNVYVFDVAPGATKSEVAKAFEMVYKHVPLKVHTLVKKPRSYFRRTSKGSQIGFGKKTKKAYIYLPKGVTIDVS